MKISYGILGLVIVSTLLAVLFDIGSPPPVDAPFENTEVAYLPEVIKHFNQPQSGMSTPALQRLDEPAIAPELAELPIFPDTPEIYQDTEPFVDADPNKPVAQSSEPDQLPQNAGAFVDAGGPVMLKSVQNFPGSWGKER